MQFASFTFLFGFLPLTWLLFQAVPGKWKNVFLAVASLVFYAWGSLSSLVLLLLILGWSWCSGWLIEHAAGKEARKKQLIIALAVLLALLAGFKYLLPWTSILLSLIGVPVAIIVPAPPLGLSFYLFSCMGALIRIAQEKSRLCSPLDFALFAAFFGWVSLGPIAHYEVIEPQMKSHPVTRRKLRDGALLFLQGLVYKVILADSLAILHQACLGEASWLGSVLCTVSYFFELYFDFAGYSRMARGVASMFGFTVPENFAKPYQARTVQEYWRRWHISLTSWFREFVYIPMGGNRVSQKRWILNILTVWILTGIWHGSDLTFIIWGLIQGGVIILEKKFLGNILEKLPGWVCHVWVIGIALIADVFFLSADIPQAFALLGRMFGIGTSGIVSFESVFLLRQGALLLIVCILVCSPLLERMAVWLQNRFRSWYSLICLGGYGLAFLVCLSFLVSQSIQAFLYAVF